MQSATYLDSVIRKIPDFPKPGILFYDITSVLADSDAFAFCVNAMSELYKDRAIDRLVAIEARGFLFAAPLAKELKKPLVLARKKGKLPGDTVSKRFMLEYGEDEIHIQNCDLVQGERLLLVDDLIATGGTLRAAADLAREAGCSIEGVFSVIGLPFLGYKEVLEEIETITLINYDSESVTPE